MLYSADSAIHHLNKWGLVERIEGQLIKKINLNVFRGGQPKGKICMAITKINFNTHANPMP